MDFFPLALISRRKFLWNLFHKRHLMSSTIWSKKCAFFLPHAAGTILNLPWVVAFPLEAEIIQPSYIVSWWFTSQRKPVEYRKRGGLSQTLFLRPQRPFTKCCMKKFQNGILWQACEVVLTAWALTEHRCFTWVKHSWKTGRILLRASKKICRYFSCNVSVCLLGFLLCPVPPPVRRLG